MRRSPLRLALGAVALVVGLVWVFQGAGLLPGSVMTGSSFWLVVGVVVGSAGLVLLILGIRGPSRTG